MTNPSVRDSQFPFPKDRPNPKQKRTTGNAERREAKRFAIGLPLRYRAEGQSGTGHVVNISSRGVLFTVEESQIPEGLVELSISWPVLLHDSVALNLVACGPIVRVDGERVAVRINKYEFRTAKAPAWKRPAGIPEPRTEMAAAVPSYA